MSFSFGTPSSAPASGLSGGFSFGANKPATPAFGLGGTQPSLGLFGTPATSAPAFGTATPAFGSTPAFGATSTAPTFGAIATPAFGATSAAPTFGASSTPAFGATATPAFGATSVASAFGATSAAPAFGATTTPAFGATTTPAFGATTTPAFGATTTPAFGATTTPAFGATPTPAFGATTTPAFGATTTPAFGATTTPAFGATSTLAFGATSTPAFGTTTPAFGNTSFGSSLSTGLGFGATTTTSATSLSFGMTTTTNAGLGGLGGFGFGATTTAQPNIGLGGTTTTGSFDGKLKTSNGQEPCLSLAPKEELRFATTSLGLGGAAPTNTAGASDGKSEPPKQTKLPNEVSTTVEAFKEFVKKQKSLSSDIMRVSIKPLQKVSREAECTLRLALALNAETSRCRAQSRRLRTSAAAALAAAETANRDPPGSELEGITPPTYVKDLISELEQHIITFRRQMDVADKQMQSSPKLLTEQELTMGMRRMHESFVALAGRLQAVHAQVQAQKEQYLNFRKYVLKDPTDVFDTSASASLDQILRDAEGTRKKSKSGFPSELGSDGAVPSDPRAALGNVQQLAGPTPFTYLGSTLSPFSAAEAQGSNWQPTPQAVNSSLNFSGFGSQTDSFQLQKPPGKRGKQ